MYGAGILVEFSLSLSLSLSYYFSLSSFSLYSLCDVNICAVFFWEERTRGIETEMGKGWDGMFVPRGGSHVASAAAVGNFVFDVLLFDLG